jgi:glutathione S-transferase
LEIETVTDTWPAIKSTTPLGQLPVFKDGDFELGQSNAILRYLARKHNLYGSNDQEKALIDMINDQQEDIRGGYLRLIYREYDTGKEAYIKGLPDTLAPLEKVLTKNNGGNGFFVGSKISFVDYSVFDILENISVLSPGSLDAFPHLKAFYGRIAARPKLAAYRATEEFKKLPRNGNGKE